MIRGRWRDPPLQPTCERVCSQVAKADFKLLLELGAEVEGTPAAERFMKLFHVYTHVRASSLKPHHASLSSTQRDYDLCRWVFA